jgi:thioredoxin-related protein
MKVVLSAIMGLFSFFSIQAQSTAALPEAPYLKNPGFPPVHLLEVDSVHYINKENIKKNHKILLIFFSPECEHCKHQTRDILADFGRFKDIQIVMATFQPFDEMKTFYNYFRIGDHANILMGRDEKYVLPPFFRMTSLPYLALYDKKGEYITHFEGNQQVDTIMKAFDAADK